MINPVKWSLLSAVFLVSCAEAVPEADAATVYKINSRAEFFEVLKKLSPGDTVDMGETRMGSLFLRRDIRRPQNSVDRLAGVTLKGGRFETVRIDDGVDVIFDGGQVIMPVTDDTKRFHPAMMFYRPTGIVIRNYDIRSDRTQGMRLGYGIRLDERGGGGNVRVEDTLIHELSSGIMAAMPHNLTVRNVTVKHISGDGFFISAGEGVLLDSLKCDTFDGTNQEVVHSDCIQIDKIAGPTVDLTIRNLTVKQETDFAQWIFGPAAVKGGRHRNWTITGTRGVGNTWRALTIHGVDGVHVEDNIMVTPSPPSRAIRGGYYATMMDIANSTDVVLRDNTACRHIRANNQRLTETGRKTASCR